MAVERNELPGTPSGKLIRDVRRVLWATLNCRPVKGSKLWKDTWSWANECAIRTMMGGWTRKRKHWPSPNEIASMFIYLAFIEIGALRPRLPYAATCEHSPALPKCVADRVIEYQAFNAAVRNKTTLAEERAKLSLTNQPLPTPLLTGE